MGHVLGRWRLDELLGVGGVAAVYAATHRNGRRVAVKVMHPELAVDEEARVRFLREGYVANHVGHTGAVAVLDDEVTDDGTAYLVMELLEGESLQARWERKGKVLPPGEVLSIADQLLDVLASAHDAGIIHRDVKPANLFLLRTGVVKLLDFGLARAHEVFPSMTIVRGSTLGTPAFMPPEQALGRLELVDQRTDLWAVGATMLTLMSGRHVHEARTVNELLLAAMTQPAPATASMIPSLPRDVARIIDRALAFDREDRFPDARSMQRAVREAYHACLSVSPAWWARTRSDAPAENEAGEGTGRLRTRLTPRSDRPSSNGAMQTVMGVVRISLAALLGVTYGTQIAPATSASAQTSMHPGGARPALARLFEPRMQLARASFQRALRSEVPSSAGEEEPSIDLDSAPPHGPARPARHAP